MAFSSRRSQYRSQSSREEQLPQLDFIQEFGFVLRDYNLRLILPALQPHCFRPIKELNRSFAPG